MHRYTFSLKDIESEKFRKEISAEIPSNVVGADIRIDVELDRELNDEDKKAIFDIVDEIETDFKEIHYHRSSSW